MRKITITQQNDRFLSGYEFIKIKEITFKFHVELTSGSSCMGFNSDLCVKMFSPEKGFINIVDNRFLNIGLGSNARYNDSSIISKLSEVFDRFEEYVNEFM